MKKYILLFPLLLIFTSCNNVRDIVGGIKEYPVNIIENRSVPEFSQESLKTALYILGVKHPDIVLRQSILETGNFSSKIFKKNNNLFGMKLARIRKTTAVGEKYGHAVYNNWIDCVQDMVLFQEYYKNRIRKSITYYSFLDGVYAEDKKYCKKLKNIKL